MQLKKTFLWSLREKKSGKLKKKKKKGGKRSGFRSLKAQVILKATVVNVAFVLTESF